MAVLQRVRVISNERLDIPDFRNLSNFNCSDWEQYFNKFMSDTPFVVTGFDITSPRSLIGTTATEVTINIANSAMFHPSSTNVRAGFFVATSTASAQTVALSPGSTNFVEMEYSLSTGAPDTRKFWDPSAAGGAGEEFSQIIDTVENLDVTVSVNTVGFTEGRIPIAQVVVNAAGPPAIVSITDSRPLFFRLGTGGANPDPLNDFIFPDDPTGSARVDQPVTIDATSVADANPFKGSDKGIRHFKDWMNAIMTRIKELGGTAFWFAPASGLISGVSLSELWWDTVGSKLTGNGVFVHSGGAAIGNLTFGNITILDGETFTLDDGINAATVFEFDNDASVGGGNVAVTIGAASVTILNTVQEFRDAAIAAINGVGGTLEIGASIGGDGIVQLINDNSGAVGNVVITETVVDGGFTVTGMANGGDTGLFTWTTDVFVRSIIGNYFFKIAAGSITLDDDEVAFLTQTRNDDFPSAATLSWTNLAAFVDGSAGAFAGLAAGDFIKKESDGIERYVRIVDFKDAASGGGASTTAAAALSVTLEVTLCGSSAAGTINVADTVTDTVDGGTATVVSISKNVFLDSDDIRIVVDTISGTFNNGNALTFTSGGTATFEQFVGRYEGSAASEKGQFSKSIYTISKAKRDDVPNSADVWWFACRADNGSSIAKIFLRDGRGIAEGSTNPISGAPSNDTLTYIGAPSATDSTPDYGIDAPGAITGSSNYNTVNGENLTIRASKLTSMMADKAQDKLIRLREGGNITWLVTGPPANTISFDADFIVQIPGSNDNNTIASSAFDIEAGQAAYFTIDRNAPSALTLIVVDEDAVPQGENIFVFAHRGANDRVYLMDGTSLGDGDVVLLGAAGTGGAGSQEFDVIIDTLNETSMSEIFGDIFENEDDTDTAETTATYDAATEVYKATADASLFDYEADFLPNSASNPDGAWALALNGASHSVASGILNVVAVAQEYTIVRGTGQDANLSTSLVTLSDAKLIANTKVNSFTKSGGDLLPWRLSIDDGIELCAVALKEDGATRQAVMVASNDTEVGTPVNVDWLAFHDIELRKIGNQRWELFIDGVLRDSIDYNAPSGAGGSTVSQRIVFKATSTENIDVDFDYIRYETRSQVYQSESVFKAASVDYPAATTPTTDPDNPWVDGALGSPVLTVDTELERLNIVDGAAPDLFNVSRSVPEWERNSLFEAEIRQEFNSTTVLSRWHLRIQDGHRHIAIRVRLDGGILKAALVNGDAFTQPSSGTEVNISQTRAVSLKIRKVRDELVKLFVDGELVDTVDYTEFTDSTAGQAILWGSNSAADNYDITVDFVRYTLPGEPLLARTSVRSVLPLVFTDDPNPSVLISTDKEHWIPVDIDQDLDSIQLAGFTEDQAGGDVYFRFGFSKNNKQLTGYGVAYNDIANEGPEQFCERQTAIADQTLFTLTKFQFVPGSCDLQVFEEGVLLNPDVDYTETSSGTITLAIGATVGDIYTFQKLQSRYDSRIENELRIIALENPKITVVAIDYLTTGDRIVGVSDTSAPRTVTISSIDIVNDIIITIKDQSGLASGNNITIATEGAETIDGAASTSITTNFGVVRLYSDGVNLFLI